eukprot:SAG22_NODE_437_length_10501_cov_3.019804_13_plen_77_part_00
MTLRSADPAVPPDILCNYLADDRDMRAIQNGVDIIRHLVRQPAFAELAGDELFPGSAVQTGAAEMGGCTDRPTLPD